MSKDSSFQPYSIWNASIQSVQGSNEAWKMAQLQWKPLLWTKWKRKYKGPIGRVLGAPCTCKWYTLSGHPRTSMHSCCCCWAECFSQGREGWWTANGEVGVLKVYRGRLKRSKGRWSSGNGLARSWLHLGFTSLHKTTFLPFDTPHSIPFDSCSSSSIKRVWGGLAHICVKGRGTKDRWQLLDTWIGSLNAGYSWYNSPPSLKTHILYEDHISIEQVITVFSKPLSFVFLCIIFSWVK